MRRFRRFRVVGAGFLRGLVLLAAIGYLGLKLADYLLVGPLVAVAETEARTRSVEAINQVALGQVGKTVRAEDLVTFVRDQQGKIAAYHVNTPLVNTIASEVAAAVHAHMKSMSAARFDVPVGALSHSRFLATYGPDIPVRLLPVGTITIDIKHEFTSAGVNQTNHRIWLHARALVRIVLPIVSREMEVTYDFPISDTVIVGEVPQYYGGKLDSVTVPVGR
ncbi:MAG TPA: sporulation protein YunB [Symbiobacteriaceae bacterium]|nr:sporulation protein YunB [Symbiobacteriaceae bacterium]